jgi:uncharacterized protein YbjT (DUF2867 family)
VRESGVDWTIVRPDWFNQNLDEGFFRSAVLAGELALPLGDLRQALVDADDIAAVAQPRSPRTAMPGSATS